MFGKSKRLKDLEVETNDLKLAVKEIREWINHQNGKIAKNGLDVADLKEDIDRRLHVIESLNDRLKTALDVNQNLYREDEESQD